MTEARCEVCGDTDSLFKCDTCTQLFCVNHINPNATSYDTHYCKDCDED